MICAHCLSSWSTVKVLRSSVQSAWKKCFFRRKIASSTRKSGSSKIAFTWLLSGLRKLRMNMKELIKMTRLLASTTSTLWSNKSSKWSRQERKFISCIRSLPMPWLPGLNKRFTKAMTTRTKSFKGLQLGKAFTQPTTQVKIYWFNLSCECKWPTRINVAKRRFPTKPKTIIAVK